MTLSFFSLPPEVRCQIYGYVFDGAHSLFEFEDPSQKPSPTPTRRNSFTSSSHGNLGFLRVSKQCYADAIESYHEARTVRVRNLGKGGLEDFNTLSHVHNTARTMELEDLDLIDLSSFPQFPKLQRLVLKGVKMWGSNATVQRGQPALDAFNEGDVLKCLFENVKYVSLDIKECISSYFPTAHIVINFRIRHQVMDKNLMRGIQDWDWACSYDVKAARLEKRLAHRLSLW